MNYRTVKDTCEALGLKVERRPDNGAESYSASFGTPGCRVYWLKSKTSDRLLALPRVSIHGADTHARTSAEIRYAVKLYLDTLV